MMSLKIDMPRNAQERNSTGLQRAHMVNCIDCTSFSLYLKYHGREGYREKPPLSSETAKPSATQPTGDSWGGGWGVGAGNSFSW